MNPLEIWYVIERGHKPAEFLAGFVRGKGVWSRDRTVAMCWQADTDAKAVLSRHKGITEGFLTATIGIISPMFARNLQSPPPPPVTAAAHPVPAPAPAKAPQRAPKKATKASAKKPVRRAR